MRSAKWARAGFATIVAVASICCGSSSSPTPSPTPLPTPGPPAAPTTNFVTGVTASDGTAASLQSGTPPAPNGGPSVTATGNSQINNGGSDVVQLQSASPFQTVFVSVSNTSGTSVVAGLARSSPFNLVPLAAADGYYRLTLSAPVTTTSLTETFAGSLPPSFTMAYAVANAAGAVGLAASNPKIVVSQPTPPPPSSIVVSSITPSPTAVVGGNSVQATVTLSGPAPSGGATVTLSNNDTAGVLTTFPSSVTVQAGSTSASFTIATRAVGGAFHITISAAFGGATVSTSLEVDPVPLIQCSFTLTSTSNGASSQEGVPAAGGSFGMNVVASPATCSWAAAAQSGSPAGMITVNGGASGTGGGSVGYTVAANTGAARGGGLVVQATKAGTTGSAQFAVHQLAAAAAPQIAVNPTTGPSNTTTFVVTGSGFPKSCFLFVLVYQASTGQQSESVSFSSDSSGNISTNVSNPNNPLPANSYFAVARQDTTQPAASCGFPDSNHATFTVQSPLIF